MTVSEEDVQRRQKNWKCFGEDLVGYPGAVFWFALIVGSAFLVFGCEDRMQVIGIGLLLNAAVMLAVMWGFAFRLRHFDELY